MNNLYDYSKVTNEVAREHQPYKWVQKIITLILLLSLLGIKFALKRERYLHYQEPITDSEVQKIEGGI